MINFIDVTLKHQNSRGIHNVSFNVHKGQFVYLMGPTGAGKSTIINSIIKSVKPDSGQILVNNYDVSKLSENDFDIILSDYNLSCKDILANYFYCNFCFNSGESFIISYDGRKIILEDSTEAIEFTKNVLSIISNMQMGSEEYDEFISTRP